MKPIRNGVITGAGLLALILIVSLPATARAHCDAMDGPVVKDAQLALKQGKVTPVLKWVRAQDEPEIRESFEQTLEVRDQGEEARALADRYFFETLVRIHRAGEGAPYTGLKPAGEGTDSGPAVKMTDKALEAGSADELVEFITDRFRKGLRERFEHARDTQQKAGEDVEAGREYVAAYVDLIHYAKDVYTAADREGGHHAGGESVPLHKKQDHP